MNYKLYRRKKRLKGKVFYSKKKPYEFNPAYRKSDKIIDIDKLSLYNEKMTNNILCKKYIRRYKNLLKLVYLLLNDNLPADSGFPAVLDEVEKLKALINDKYHKYISLEKEKLFLKELDYIEAEAKKHLIERIIFEQQFIEQNDFIR